MAGKFLLYVNQRLDATSDKISSFSSYLKEPKEALGQPVLEFAILNLERGANIIDFKNLGWGQGVVWHTPLPQVDL